MTDGTGSRTTDDEFQQAFSVACADVIAAARRLKSRLVAGDLEAARELGRLSARRMAEVGATKDEVEHYMHRILASVLAEPQA